MHRVLHHESEYYTINENMTEDNNSIDWLNAASFECNNFSIDFLTTQSSVTTPEGFVEPLKF